MVCSQRGRDAHVTRVETEPVMTPFLFHFCFPCFPFFPLRRFAPSRLILFVETTEQNNREGAKTRRKPRAS